MKSIENASEKITILPEEELGKMMERFINQQPYLSTYLMALGENELSEYELEYMFFVALNVWHACEIAGCKCKTVEEDVIFEIEERNIKMLEYFDEESDTEFSDDVLNLINHHPQSALLEYVTMLIMDDEESEEEMEDDDIDEEQEISEEGKGVMFVIMKTFIECLDYEPKNRSKK